MKTKTEVKGFYCWTWNSKKYHKLVAVATKNNLAWQESKCGIISSPVNAFFWTFSIKRNLHQNLEPCKKCFPEIAT